METKEVSSIVFICLIVFFIGYALGDNNAITESNTRINALAEKCDYEYGKIITEQTNKYNNLVEEYNELNNQIPIYENQLLSCGIKLN